MLATCLNNVNRDLYSTQDAWGTTPCAAHGQRPPAAAPLAISPPNGVGLITHPVLVGLDWTSCPIDPYAVRLLGAGLYIRPHRGRLPRLGRSGIEVIP